MFTNGIQHALDHARTLGYFWSALWVTVGHITVVARFRKVAVVMCQYNSGNVGMHFSWMLLNQKKKHVMRIHNGFRDVI